MLLAVVTDVTALDLTIGEELATVETMEVVTGGVVEGATVELTEVILVLVVEVTRTVTVTTTTFVWVAKMVVVAVGVVVIRTVV